MRAQNKLLPSPIFAKHQNTRLAKAVTSRSHRLGYCFFKFISLKFLSLVQFGTFLESN